MKHDTVVARAMLPGYLQTIRLTEKLGVEPREIHDFSKVEVGDRVEKEQLVGQTNGIWGFFKTFVHSEFEGEVEGLSEVTGNMLIREAPIPVDMLAYIEGTVKEVLPEEGAIIETRGAMVQGIFGIGGEGNGPVRVAVASHSDVLDAIHIQDGDKGKILVGGSGVTFEALKRANEIGVQGILVGAVRDVDLTELLGYDIGVAITGQEDVATTLVVTEGFGQLAMAERTFKLLQTLEGKSASINGATQIRAGVIRPELIAPNPAGGVAAVPQDGAGSLGQGTPIRIIREPYFGRLGTVVDLPAQLQTVDSGAEVRVLTAKLDSGEEVTVPRANVEIIATS